MAEPEPELFAECPRKALLATDLRLAVSALIALQNIELESAIAGNVGVAITVELERAKIRKDQAILAYTSHLRQHGC